MGEPAIPTLDERKRRRDLARAVVESVTDDESVAAAAGLSVLRVERVDYTPVFSVEEVLFALAQELQMLRDELDTVDSAIDDWDWAALALDTEPGDPLRWVARIEAARKEARRG